MMLYSDPRSADSHRVRMVVAEKGISIEVRDVDPRALPEDVHAISPYGTVPVLVDRDLVLYEARVIMDYLDERFPHPPLMPVDPVSRARARLALYRIERDWYGLLPALEGRNEKQAAKARKELAESLVAGAEIFAAKPFFLSDEFSLLDCCVAPILWRLPAWGVELPATARPVLDYARRIFARESFRASLTEAERELNLDGLSPSRTGAAGRGAR